MDRKTNSEYNEWAIAEFGQNPLSVALASDDLSEDEFDVLMPQIESSISQFGQRILIPLLASQNAEAQMLGIIALTFSSAPEPEVEKAVVNLARRPHLDTGVILLSLISEHPGYFSELTDCEIQNLSKAESTESFVPAALRSVRRPKPTRRLKKF